MTGETYNGHLLKTDTFMNLVLTNVVNTRPDGRFFQMESVYLRGSGVKYLRVAEGVLQKVKEEQRERVKERNEQRSANRGRGRGNGRK